MGAIHVRGQGWIGNGVILTPFHSTALRLLAHLPDPLRGHAATLLGSALWCGRSAYHYRAMGRRVPDLPGDEVVARAAARLAREDDAAGYRVLPQIDGVPHRESLTLPGQ